MKTILVPLDGSALAEQTLASVRMLAPLVGAKIHLLRVIADEAKDAVLAGDPAVLYAAGATGVPMRERETRVWDMLRYHAEGYLDGQALSLRKGGWDVDTQVQIGAPAETIVAVADRIGADLITMATHGYTGFKRWALGSITANVVRATTTPVFVVPGSTAAPADDPRLTRIMLTLDGSAFAKQALPLATELAACACAELILFRVVAPMVDVSYGTLPPTNVQVALRTHALNDLRGLAGELRHYDLLVKTVVVIGNAAEQIVAVAAQRQVDLIVMATHGYSGMKRWALGSVADKVLHATPTPLLLVHAHAHD